MGKGDKRSSQRSDSGSSNLVGKFTQSVRRIVQDVKDEGTASGLTKEQVIETNERLRAVRIRLDESYDTAKKALVSLMGKYNDSKSVHNVFQRYSLLKAMIKEVIRLETQYWTLVDIPKQEKQETVPAFVLRACAIMEKTQKSGEGVKTSAKLAEEAQDKKERIERLEDMTTAQIEAENTQMTNDLYRLLKKYSGLRNLIRQLKVTAKAIAQKIGILTNRTVLEIAKYSDLEHDDMLMDYAIVVHGAFLKTIPGEDLDDIIDYHSEIVFARTTPTQKLLIVESCQRLGEIVAVTGDGVNDAPALRKADIGIAMGVTGTEVSQQAADMILLDDNFASIVLGIEEGRKIFDNLKKSITYTLASNVPEILPFLAHVLLQVPLPLGIIAILCIDLLTDMMPAISLAYERAETDILTRPPRNPLRDKLVSRKLYFLAYCHLGLIEALNAFLIYIIVMAEHGFLPGSLIGLSSAEWIEDVLIEDSYGQMWTRKDRINLEYKCYTAVFVSVVVSQWFNLLACKTKYNSFFQQGMRNHILTLSIVIETLLACLLAYVPYNNYLKFFPIPFRYWLFSMPMGLVLFIFDELRKLHIRKYPRGYYQRETDY